VKILSAKSLGIMPVYDLSVDHEHHSFVHSSGVVLHNCAFVVTNEPVTNFIPLTSVGNEPCTQFTAASVEAVGGVKMDYLGLNSLDDIAVAIELIQERQGLKLDGAVTIDGEKVLAHEVVPFNGQLYNVWKLPESQGVFRDFCESKTETVFQFATDSAKQWLGHFNHVKETRADGTVVKALDSIEALAAFTALDRPGPLDYFVETKGGKKHNMLVEFAIRARGGERTGSLPILDELLPETYGVITYQEQLQKVFEVVGGTTAEQGDEFRVHISKKKMDLVMKDKAIFMPGAIAKLGEKAAEDLWSSMETFGQYGFNKSHATAYVTVSFACAFLKHHYPLEWWCAVLRHADKDEINNEFWPACGHLIDLPDVGVSKEKFVIVGERIRAPLTLLHGIGPGAHAQLMQCGPYLSVDDFCQKIVKWQKDNKAPDYEVEVKEDVLDEDGNPTGETATVKKTKAGKKGHNALNKGVIATLIVSGAMDSLFPPGILPPDAMDMYVEAMRIAKGKKRITKDLMFDPKYRTLNQLMKYQMRKAIVPAYTEPLTVLVLGAKPAAITIPKDTTQRATLKIGDKDGQIGTYADIQQLDKLDPWPMDMGGVTVAAVGYVVEARRFNYGDGKSREALELVLDLDGGRFQAVRWGDKKGKLPEHLQKAEALKGAIVAALYSKWKADRPFAVDDLVIIQPPLDHTTPEQSPDPVEESK
jgi:hypothetical protein